MDRVLDMWPAMLSNRAMRRLAIAVLTLALGHGAGSAAAQTIDAGVPVAGPVLVDGGVAWSDATARTPTLLLSAGGAAPRTLVRLSRDTDDGLYTQGSALTDLSASADRIAYTVSQYDSAASKYGGGTSLVSSAAYSVAAAGGAPARLQRCEYLHGSTAAALGDSFTVLRGCLSDPPIGGAPAPPAVTIGGAVAGSGTAIAAAGPFAAWSLGSTVTVARATPALSVLGTVPAAGAWTLAPDGGVVTAAAGVGTTSLALTPPGGVTAAIGDEPGGVFGLTAGAGGAIAFATQGDGRSQTVVVRRGGERLEVARFWPDPAVSAAAVATDGTRVAWFSARCGGSDLTVATIGEPLVDQRGAACPVAIAARGTLSRSVLSPQLSCDMRVAPQPCSARVRIRARGRLIAAGTVALSDTTGGPVRLTRAGRRLVGGRRRVRARVEAVRSVAGGAPLTTRRTVMFTREP
jgi:hypothetical protein